MQQARRRVTVFPRFADETLWLNQARIAELFQEGWSGPIPDRIPPTVPPTKADFSFLDRLAAGTALCPDGRDDSRDL